MTRAGWRGRGTTLKAKVKRTWPRVGHQNRLAERHKKAGVLPVPHTTLRQPHLFPGLGYTVWTPHSGLQGFLETPEFSEVSLLKTRGWGTRKQSHVQA